jgi:CheY-like chemotaxis protein
MTPEIRSRIFEPFFTTKGVGKGTGLGLSMVYGCVQQLNGAINVYSEPGIGTTFKIYLPIAGACPEGNAEVSHLTVSGKETIVIAEDDKLVRDLVVRILTDAGYSVLSARDGAEAVELCDAHADSVSLVLLDAVMPNLTGYQAFALIKSKFPDLPVVFCSGYDPETSQAALLTTKGLPVVQKPFDPDLLLRAIREALDSQPRRAASSRLLLSQ